jgi:hypoxanthine phosphoribosyltransferase
VKPEVKVVYSPARLSARVAQMGRAISRDYAGRTVDVVVLENAFVFAADLIRHISCPVVCHFVLSEMRDIHFGGFERREIFFIPEPHLAGCDVLLVDVVLQSGVTLDFLAKRLQQSRPRSFRVAVLLDRPQDRKVDLQPDYFGFKAASNYLVGYGLPGNGGLYRNLPYVGSPDSGSSRAPRAPASRPRRKRTKSVR